MKILGLSLTTVLLGLSTLPAQGDRIRTPRPVIRGPKVFMEATRVSAKIVDGVAETKVTMVIRNDGNMQGEKVLLFPLPEGASADGIKMKVNGVVQEGDVIEERRARSIYEGIVRRRRDPALLEYVGRDLLRLRVFPVPAHGKQEVEVRYRLLLPQSGGFYRYEFPTRAVEGGTFALDVTIESQKSIKNVYSPMQGFDIAQKGDHGARGSYESKQRPKRDPVLFYGLSDKDFGLNMLTYKKKGEKEGYFLCMIAPKRDWKAEKELKKSITFVIDTSGSMQGEKIQQARKAMLFFLQSLSEGDRFNVIPFSTEARPFAPAPVEVSKEQIEKAKKFAEGLVARGGTNIHEAMQKSLEAGAPEGMVSMVVFLTDGQPTVGNSNIADILRDSAKANTHKSRIFCFGVGNDVNTQLLDKLSEASGGTRDYVVAGEKIEVKTSALFAKLAHPVMTGCELVADGIKWDRRVPNQMPPLFKGSVLVVAGRYTGTGHKAIRLTGSVSGAKKEFVYEAEFPEDASQNDFVAAIWAQRRIGLLLDSIRLNGRKAELVSEVRRIGKKHGIVSPFTSALIVEERDRIANGLNGRRSGGVGGGGGFRVGATGRDAPAAQKRARRDLERAGAKVAHGNPAEPEDSFGIGRGKRAPSTKAGQPSTPTPGTPSGPSPDRSGWGANSPPAGSTSGKKAVERSRKVARLYYLDKLDDEAKTRWTSHRIKDKTFHFVSGLWIDHGFTKAHSKKITKVVAFSPEYFALLKKHKALAPYFAFSTSILIVLDDGTAVEVLPEAPTKSEPKKEKEPAAGKTGK
jgi:Ca-activated chloride channel homolog